MTIQTNLEQIIDCSSKNIEGKARLTTEDVVENADGSRQDV